MPRVIHFGIHASDCQRAIKFYTDVFAWKFIKWEGPVDYWTIETGPEEEPGINGGLILRKGSGKGDDVISYVNSIEVPSLEEYLKKVLDHGGHQVVATMPIPGIGWLAYCKDTENNVFGMMQEDASAG